MTAIVAELLTETGAPQVGVTVTGLDSGDQIISVQVSWDSGDTWRAVAGGDHVVAVGGEFVRDHFPPLNIESIWRVVEHSLSGEPTTESDALTVTSSVSYIQDSLNPRDAVSLIGAWPTSDESLLMWGTTADAAWRQTADYAQVLGADRPVASVGQRMIAGAVPMRVGHEVAAEGGKLRRLLLSSGTLVLRPHESTMLEPVAHIAVGDADEHVVRTSPQVSTWDLTVTQVRPLSLRFVVPWWTYAQVAALYDGDDYATVAASKPDATYLDWAKDPTP